MTVGESIRRIRKEQGLTQKELGKLCNVNESQIRRYELGLNNSNPKLETVKKIANALNVTTDELYGVTNTINYFTEDFFEQNQYLGEILLDFCKKEIKKQRLSIHDDDIFIPLESEFDNFSSNMKAELFNEIFDHVSYSDDMKIVKLYPKLFTSDSKVDIDKSLKENYLKLNARGKKEAVKRIFELTQIKKYTE